VPEHLERQGLRLKGGYNDLAAELGLDFTRCVGYGCRSMVTFDGKVGDPLEMKSLVQQELIRRGILWGGFHNMSFSHSDADLDHTLGAYREVLAILRDAVAAKDVRARLHGEPVEAVFRRTTGFNLKPRAPRAEAEKVVR
jgi:glutamate-1-semialdehyde aminotransferase